MSLENYYEKRNFKTTPEPKGLKRDTKPLLSFVVQKHSASHLHFDFRLELDGVLKSWAVPKGPSTNPNDKRLAMMVEDHPLDYQNFEGLIPKGNYGAGSVIVWDKGFYSSSDVDKVENSEKKIKEGLAKGHFSFLLAGEKLKGKFTLTKVKTDQDSKENSWLLIKNEDDYANKDISKQTSVLSGKTLEEVEKDSKSPKWLSKKFADLKNLPSENFPNKFSPMLATLGDKPFDSANWIFEIKWDGYRTIAEIKNGEVNLLSRNNKSFNDKFADLVPSLRWENTQAVLDGEVVVLDENGKPNFSFLQNYPELKQGKLVYYVFDIAHLNGHNLRSLPLLERKKILKDVLLQSQSVRFSEHIEKNGNDFFELAKKSGLEGIVAKKEDSSYLPGKRVETWLKIKVKKQQEAVIAGYTEPRGGRKFFGALVLGVYENNKLVYIGHTGGGFDERNLQKTFEKLTNLKTKDPPFEEVPKTNSPVTWVKPQLVCEVSFSEWTSDGHLRQPIFLGLREDKYPEEVHKETEKQNPVELTAKDEEEISIQGKVQTVTNLDKVFWPEKGFTKKTLIEYYLKIADFILPYLKDRPESLLRFPNGVKENGFFQKNFDQPHPEWVQTFPIESESEGRTINYVLCQDISTLVYLTNLGCIDFNPWSSRIQNLDKPDFLVIDLDPLEIAFSEVVKTALTVHEVFEKLKIKNYCKTSGATGLHIYVPLAANYSYEQVKVFSEIVANIVNKKLPKTTSVLRSPSKRQGRVYLDFLQNRKGQTLAAPYSVRAREEASVSTPLLWEEVNSSLDPKKFTIENIPKRLEEKGDLWKEVLIQKTNFEQALKNLQTF